MFSLFTAPAVAIAIKSSSFSNLAIWVFSKDFISSKVLGVENLSISETIFPVSSITTFPSGVLTTLINSFFGNFSFVITQVLHGILFMFILLNQQD